MTHSNSKCIVLLEHFYQLNLVEHGTLILTFSKNALRNVHGRLWGCSRIEQIATSLKGFILLVIPPLSKFPLHPLRWAQLLHLIAYRTICPGGLEVAICALLLWLISRTVARLIILDTRLYIRPPETCSGILLMPSYEQHEASFLLKNVTDTWLWERPTLWVAQQSTSSKAVQKGQHCWP